MNQFDLIIFNGAPGIGKSTLCSQLGVLWKCPVIDFGKLREFHLDSKWERKSDQEEEMTFEVLCSMLKIYLQHGLKNILINDLQDWRVKRLNETFKETHSLIVSLYISDPKILRQRIETRNCGWKDVNAAWQRNEDLLKRPKYTNEIRVDMGIDGIDAALNLLIGSIENAK